MVPLDERPDARPAPPPLGTCRSHCAQDGERERADAVANQDANELARQVADTAAGFDCAKDEPNVVGKTGKSPM